MAPTSSVTQLQDAGGTTFDYNKTDALGQDLEFMEEPCGLLAVHGFGFFNAEFGERIGPNNRYEILRKLGFGMSSSVWLAKDHEQSIFVCIKILTGHATALEKQRLTCELDVLRHISEKGKYATKTHCLSLLDHFYQSENEPGEGEHLCLVTQPFGPTIAELTQDNGPTVSEVKKALKDVLKGLAYLHDLGIVHTDIHPGNILVDIDYKSSSFDVESSLRMDPPRRYAPEQTVGDSRYVRVAVSQPFPAAEFRDWKFRSFIVGDFGSAQFINKHLTDDIGPIQIRAPEIILGLPWNEKVDLWAFGCLVYQCLTGSPLFSPLTSEPELFILHQIFSFTGERLPMESIQASKRGRELLHLESGLPKGIYMPGIRASADVIEELRMQSGDPAIDGVDSLLKKCLRMDPKDRLSAKELLEDPWINSDAV